MSETTNILAPDPSSNTPPPADSPPPAGAGWLDEVDDDGLRGLAEAKGWQGPGDVLKGYKHLEKFMGADSANRGLLAPKDTEDHEAYDAIYKALGRPENPEGYQLMELFGDQAVDADFLKAMGTGMHGSGLSARQAQEVAQLYQGQLLARQEELGQRVETEMSTLRAGWGAESERNQALLSKGAQTLGLDEQSLSLVVQAFDGQINGLVAGLITVGKLAGEDQLPRGINGANGGAMSPAGTRARVDALLGDKAFSEKYLDGDKSAFEQVQNMYKQIDGMPPE